MEVRLMDLTATLSALCVFKQVSIASAFSPTQAIHTSFIRFKTLPYDTIDTSHLSHTSSVFKLRGQADHPIL